MRFISKAVFYVAIVLIFAISGVMFLASREIEKHTVTSSEILQWYVVPCVKHSIRQQGITDPSQISQRLESYLHANKNWIMAETLQMSTQLSGNEFKRFDKRRAVYNQAVNQCKKSL